MTRFGLALWISLASVGAAFAQVPGTVNGATSSSGNVTKGTAGQPPAAAGNTGPVKLNHTDNSAIGANVPTLPQVALHPTATIGTGTPMAGPGGTTRNAVGN